MINMQEVDIFSSEVERFNRAEIRRISEKMRKMVDGNVARKL